MVATGLAWYFSIKLMRRKSAEALESTFERLKRTAELLRSSQAVLNHTPFESKIRAEPLVGRGLLTCKYCGKAVSLETANTDSDGRALHEHCYLAKLLCL